MPAASSSHPEPQEDAQEDEEQLDPAFLALLLPESEIQERLEMEHRRTPHPGVERGIVRWSCLVVLLGVWIDGWIGGWFIGGLQLCWWFEVPKQRTATRCMGFPGFPKLTSSSSW